MLTRGALQERGEVGEVAGAAKETSRSALGPGEGSRLCGPPAVAPLGAPPWLGDERPAVFRHRTNAMRPIGGHPMTPRLGLLSLLSRPEESRAGREAPPPPPPSSGSGAWGCEVHTSAHHLPRASLRVAGRRHVANGKEMNEPPLGNLPSAFFVACD